MNRLHMPDIDQSLFERRDQIIDSLRTINPGENVISDTTQMRVYETDGLTAYTQVPFAVVLPETISQLAQTLAYCYQNDIKVVPRGAGTSLSGGALPLADGILLSMMKFNKILEIDIENRVAVVESGVTNSAISEAAKPYGFYYAPDPSSQIACSIGGNVAENAGGVHCLKYGLTTNNVLGVEFVTMEGEIVSLGGKHLDSGGYDLLGMVVGSEGMLGVVTKVTVRLLKIPEMACVALIGFPSCNDASSCVADIIGAGIIPAGMEMMDRPAIHAAEDFVKAGYPLDVDALLIVELDGPSVEINYLFEQIGEIARNNNATEVRISKDEAERLRFWAGRKAAFPAAGRISADYLCMDGTIPRKSLAYVLEKINQFAKKYELGIANVFHAGDGNLHPLILYDARIPQQLEKAERFGADILRLCVEVGGVLTGEHGIGVEKRDLMPEMFNKIDMDHQIRVKCAFDPKQLLNPGKVFPQFHRCAELGWMHVHGGKLPFPDIPRF